MSVPHAQAYIDAAIGITMCGCIGAGMVLLAWTWRAIFRSCPECGREC